MDSLVYGEVKPNDDKMFNENTNCLPSELRKVHSCPLRKCVKNNVKNREVTCAANKKSR